MPKTALTLSLVLAGLGLAACSADSVSKPTTGYVLRGTALQPEITPNPKPYQSSPPVLEPAPLPPTTPAAPPPPPPRPVFPRRALEQVLPNFPTTAGSFPARLKDFRAYLKKPNQLERLATTGAPVYWQNQVATSQLKVYTSADANKVMHPTAPAGFAREQTSQSKAILTPNAELVLSDTGAFSQFPGQALRHNQAVVSSAQLDTLVAQRSAQGKATLVVQGYQQPQLTPVHGNARLHDYEGGAQIKPHLQPVGQAQAVVRLQAKQANLSQGQLTTEVNFAALALADQAKPLAAKQQAQLTLIAQNLTNAQLLTALWSQQAEPAHSVLALVLAQQALNQADYQQAYWYLLQVRLSGLSKIVSQAAYDLAARYNSEVS